MNAPVSGPELRTIANDPPAGFRLIDFQRDSAVVNFNTHVGPLYWRRGEKGSRDEFVMGFRVQPYMCNPAGTLHGGMMMTVAVLVGGMGATILAGIRGKFVPTVSMTFDFVAPAREGDWVEGRAELVRATRSLLFSHIWLTVGDTRILRASCIVKVPSGDGWMADQGRGSGEQG
jgi:uncharacterized protein (TIGR00369 family)